MSFTQPGYDIQIYREAKAFQLRVNLSMEGLRVVIGTAKIMGLHMTSNKERKILKTD
jgi:hypothetical protein